MSNYKYQTIQSRLLKGELGMVGGQLTTTDGTVQVILGNPLNSTAVSSLTASYAEEQMDVSNAKTLGTGFVFLNGTSYDGMGGCDYELDEADGRVFGLYGRSDGMAQQVYYAGASSTQSDLQFTTVAYIPSWLSGSVWQAAAIAGGDLFGFTLVLRNTSDVSAALRYVYVRHGGSLINTAGHSYVDITQTVAAYVADAGGLDYSYIPKIVRVGAYFFITIGSWAQQKIWIGGWNAQDSTYPFSTAAFPATQPTYAPQAFNIQTNNWPENPGLSAASIFPAVWGGQTAQNVQKMFRLYNEVSGQLITPIAGGFPGLPTVEWLTANTMTLDGEVDASGNPYLAFGATGYGVTGVPNYVYFDLTYSLSVQFTAGSAGAYTQAQLTYNTPGTNGVDLLHAQPFPYIISFNPNLPNTQATGPNETVSSNPATPLTCANKLPCTQYFDGSGLYYGEVPRIVNYFYNGGASLVAPGSGALLRGVMPLSLTGVLGSAAKAQQNKLAHIYPMYNVNPRYDYSTGKTSMSLAKVQPSGLLSRLFPGTLIAKDTILSPGYLVDGSQAMVVSKMPTNSQLSNASYNRDGLVVPGFGARVGEYLTDIVNVSGTGSFSNNNGHLVSKIWQVGISDLDSPINGFSNGLAYSVLGNEYSANNQPYRLGTWTLSGGIYTQPPIVWNTASNFRAQLQALLPTAFAAAGAKYSNRGGTVIGVEVAPILNSAGNNIVGAIGMLSCCNGSIGSSPTSTNFETYFFTTGMSVSGGIINLTNTSSVTVWSQYIANNQGTVGTYSSNDSFFGRMHHIYLDATNSYFHWTPVYNVQVVGDGWNGSVVGKMSGTSFTEVSSLITSEARAMWNCSASLQGFTWSAQNGVSYPQSDIPIQRYTTSAVNAVSDFSASFESAISNMGGASASNVAEMMTLRAISNTFLLQLGAVNGRLNHKEYNLPSTFIDATSLAVGTYYLYLQDTGTAGVKLIASSLQISESPISMYFGRFDRTSSGFANESSVAEVVRFGTARLVSGSGGTAMQGSQIRIGAYVG